MKILIEHGSNLDLQSQVFIFFFLILIFILFCSFFNNSFLLKDGWTALHYAVRQGVEQIAKILVENGANLDLQTQVLIFFFLILIFISFCSFLTTPFC